jgi:hypothetical protein
VLPWNISGEIAGLLRAGGFAGRILIAVPEMREIGERLVA